MLLTDCKHELTTDGDTSTSDNLISESGEIVGTVQSDTGFRKTEAKKFVEKFTDRLVTDSLLTAPMKFVWNNSGLLKLFQEFNLKAQEGEER